ncbi:uncharacterized protein LOC132785819 isoform X1 [Drosophila nasuta]|uniref:uncharacterized protein LOC132785819 isoform X1 n=1 Tax=Drosophila nasuta TaxID=42062 RepID=UPI00295E6B1F|nr:uncharacterized protein LOC132785819 isoform X1 [Drosophila nasuta]XP_060648084.1 uncharacterized protein LOC132785819 isoform X1 [Drosophila nasuta]
MNDLVTVNFNEIQSDEELGRGSYGVVHKASWKTELEVRQIAVKIIEDKQTENINFEKDIHREIQNLQKCIHPNIITLYGVSINTKNNICLLFEYADCGSLYDLLHRKNLEVSFNGNLDWMLQCAKGIEYLHKKNIVHRDLKTHNLLLFNGYRTLKICDFGTVKELVTMNTELVGTVCYMAPEVCNLNGKYKEKCDVFSFGIIFWEVMSRKKPFYEMLSEDMHVLAIQNKIIDGSRPNIEDAMIFEDSDCVRPIIEKCWDRVPENRPTMQEICELLPMYPLAYSYINVDEIELGKFIGRGSYGFVHNAFCLIKGQIKEMSVKIIQKYSEENAISFLREMRNVKMLNHENIVKLYGVSKYYDNSIWLLFEYADCGSLYKYLHNQNIKITQNERIDWLVQCAKGIEYLHSINRIHKDLKTQKLYLFDEYRTLKICDNAAVGEFADMNTTQENIARYMAPEICNASGEFTEKSDVFSFGIICWEVMSRKKPFEEFKDMEKLVLQNKIMNGERPDIDYLKEYKDADILLPIIKKCWDQDPSNRPPMNELCNLLPKYPRASIKVNYNALKLGTYIGTGSYGLVFKSTWQTKYEVRDITVKIIRDAQKQKAIQKEIHDLKALYHANIAKLYGFSIDREDRILMLVEYADCGSLCNFLHRPDKEVTFYMGLDWILQCAEGMEYLHGKNILHQDLKTENLLLFDNFRILKICDYGRVKEFATMNKEFSGIDNRAPEVRTNGQYTAKSDVFSFALLSWEVMSRKKSLATIMNGERPNLIEMMKHEDIDVVKSIIKKCWDQDPDKRPTMKELCVLLKIYPLINFEDIQFGKRFERGGFGVSYKAIWKTEGQEKDVSAKILLDKTSNSEKVSRGAEMLFLKKAHNFKQLKHENVGTLYGVSKDPENTIYFSLYEYSECGSVHNFLHRTKNELTYIEKINWMLQCAKGVEYLWSQGITLRFIKPQTLMLFDDFRTLKVFDYGSAKEVSKFNKQEMVQFVYIAPEIHDARKNSDFKKSLVFSFGVIFWEVMSRKVPFHDYEIADVPKIIISESRPNIDDIKSCNDAYLIKPIIEKCWDQNAENRPTIMELSSLLSYLTAGKL